MSKVKSAAGFDVASYYKADLGIIRHPASHDISKT